MEKRIGIFYGVSVGPGDPELMTLQAVRRLENCPVIAAPQTPKGGMLALDIAKGAVELSGKTILPLRFAMSLDPAVQKAAHIEAARAVKEYLDAGQDVAMLNLGDVSVYATFGYLQEILEAEGCKTVMLPGVTSFCAVAARLNTSLTGIDTPLHIVPGGCGALEECLAQPGAKVLMKSGRQLPGVLARRLESSSEEGRRLWQRLLGVLELIVGGVQVLFGFFSDDPTVTSILLAVMILSAVCILGPYYHWRKQEKENDT